MEDQFRFEDGEKYAMPEEKTHVNPPAVGLILYEHRFEFDWVQAPYITSEMQYVHTGLNRPIRVYKNVDSRLILKDMYCKLALFAQKQA